MRGFFRWKYDEVNMKEIDRIAEDAGISRLPALALCKRGIKDKEAVDKFLNPDIKDFHDPFLMDGMDRAVERVVNAIKGGEKVIIHGDYDVDGVTATSILYNYLTSAGLKVDYHVPHRMSEGYGISDEGVRVIKESGATLVITVDCGISATEEVEEIMNSGIDVIVTDHHECGNIIPDALAVLNPCKPGDEYPFKGLSGAGVVFKLLQAVSGEAGCGSHMDYLDLAALGTVADIVPLLDENRVMVKYGLDAMENTDNVGLRSLMEVSGVFGKRLESWHLGYIIGPRVNAAGRLSDASNAVRLFTCNDYNEAFAIAQEMENQNGMRRKIENDIFEEAMKKIHGERLDNDKVVMVSGEGWHRGVIGIVASRITEQLAKPAIVVSTEEGEATASARSLEGFNMYKALESCSCLFERYGGHKMAAGFTTSPANVDKIREALNKYPVEGHDGDVLVPVIRVDEFVETDDISLETIRELERMKPFGEGNPNPVFGALGLKVLERRFVGGGKHLKLVLESNGLEVDAIGFNMANADSNSSDTIDALFRMEINTWRGRDRVQLNLVDIKTASEAISESMYYESLCNCLEYFNWEDTGFEPDDKSRWFQDITGIMETTVDEGGRVIVLVNALDELYHVADCISGLSYNIKKCFKICYNKLDGGITDYLTVLVNPLPDYFSADGFDTVVVFGNWLNRGYLERITGEIADKGRIICVKGTGIDSLDAVVPDRDDLAMLYRYLKSRPVPLRIDDMQTGMEEYKGFTGAKTNLFKIRTALEIFRELELLDIRDMKGNGVEVMIRECEGRKKNLMDSGIFKGLQCLVEKNTR